MAKKRPLILVTNDDGITAPGIRALIQIMNTISMRFIIEFKDVAKRYFLKQIISTNFTMHNKNTSGI